MLKFRSLSGFLICYWSETIIGYIRFMKCMLYLIYFVNISLGFIIPEIYSMSSYFDWWHSWTTLSLRFKCLMRFDVTESAHWTADFLSLYILVRAYDSIISILLSQCFMDWSSVVHSLVAMNSNLQELRAVSFLQIDFYEIEPPEWQMRKPEIERNLKSSRGVPTSTALPNWPPQLAF